jgi:hypothetical protein
VARIVKKISLFPSPFHLLLDAGYGVIPFPAANSAQYPLLRSVLKFLLDLDNHLCILSSVNNCAQKPCG